MINPLTIEPAIEPANPAHSGFDGVRGSLVAVTGANGFIGRHLIQALAERHLPAVAVVRRPSGIADERVVDFSSPDALTDMLAGVRVLVHCAGFAHAHSGSSIEENELQDRVNRRAVLETARSAVKAGVRRFVFLSSVKAVGESGEQCVDESFASSPNTPYGKAKRAAEEGLLEIQSETGIEVVILRLSMVYGPGSRGNLERMLRLVAKGRFPPLPETGNRRSMVHVNDLVEAIFLAAFEPTAAGRTYNVAHPRPVSGRELYVLMCQACGRAAGNWSVPEGALRWAGAIGDLARSLRLPSPLTSQVVASLLDSACYSSAAIEAELGWAPRVDIATGIKGLLARSAEKRW